MNLINTNIYDNIPPSNVEQVQGWNSYGAIFQELISEKRPDTIIEVGTWLGASAINMAKIVKQLSLNTKIYCVDTWLGAEEFWTWERKSLERGLNFKNGYPQVYFDFLSNVVQHQVQDIIIPIPNTSHIGAKILKYYNIKADLIYIDGSHDYADVKQDITDYKELLNPNGIMFGDDVLSWGSVNEAVNEMLGDKYEIKENNYWVYRT